MQKLIDNIKDLALKKELSFVLNKKSKSEHYLEQVTYFCKNNIDENRFVTAWDYIEVNVKHDVDLSLQLKKAVVDFFCSDPDITENNKENLK